MTTTRRGFLRFAAAAAAVAAVRPTIAPVAPKLAATYPRAHHVSWSVDMLYGGDVVRPELGARLIG